MFRPKRRRGLNTKLMTNSTCDISETTGLDSMESFDELRINRQDTPAVVEDTQGLLNSASTGGNVVQRKNKNLYCVTEQASFRQKNTTKYEELPGTPSSVINSDDEDAAQLPSSSQIRESPGAQTHGTDFPISPISQSPLHQDGLAHIYHDDLATLYEGDTLKSMDEDDEPELSRSASPPAVRETTLMDELTIRARWDFAMQAMTSMGQCDSASLYRNFANWMPQPKALEAGDVETGEI